MAKKKPATRQPTLDDLITGGYRYVPLEDQPEPEPAAPEKSSLARRALGDTGIALAKGAIGVPEAMVGMADLVTGGQAGRLAEQAGFRPKDAKAYLDEFLTPEQQAANQAVQQAEGFTGKLGAAVSNPSVIWQSAVESAPSMLAGAGVARGAMAVAPKLPGVVAAGLGEGAVSAGQTAEQVRQETADGTLTGAQAGIAATSGALTGVLGMIAGKVAQKLGIGDVDTLLAGVKNASPNVQKGVIRSVLEGAVSEGVLEELPQSVQEQVAQNMALGKPLDEGVDHAAVLGMLAGGLMGGVAGPLAATGSPEGNAIRGDKVPEVGPLTRSLNTLTETRAQQADAGMPTVTADQATVEAQARMADLEKKTQGTEDAQLPGPDGEPVDIPGTPGQVLTTAEAEEQKFLTENKDNPEALARAQGATISPLMRQPDAAIPGALPPDTALARMEDLAKQQAQADRGMARADARAEAAAAAPAPAAPAADDAAPPPELDDILNPKGEPFKNKMAVGKARKAQANPDDFVIASVAGGFVLRPVKKEKPDGGVAISAERGPAGSDGAGPAVAGGSLGADGRPAAEPGSAVPAGTVAAAETPADAGVEPGRDASPVAADVAGEPIDAEWTAFKPETGTKAIPRADMPQIKAEHRGAMTQFLKARGIAHEQEQDVDPTTLKPTQAEFSTGKVQKAREFTDTNRAILVSNDGHVLDGHHQWLAAREDGKPIRVIRFDAPIEQLMEQAKEFPSSTTAEGATEPTVDATLDTPAPAPAAEDTPQARRDVVDYMNGDIDKPTLIQKLADSGLGEGMVWNVTNRLGDDFVQADMNDVEAIRAGKQPQRKNPVGYDAPAAAPAPAAESDYFTELFGTPEQQAAAQSDFMAKQGAKAAEVQRIRDAIAKEQKRAKAEHDDWASRTYKANSTQVDLRGDGPSRQDSMSIGAINESRRRNAMEALSQELNALDKLASEVSTDAGAERVLTGLRDLREKAKTAVKSGNWPGYTDDGMFESMLLDGLKFRGPGGKGNVTSNGLSKAMLAALGESKPAPAAAPAAAPRKPPKKAAEARDAREAKRADYFTQGNIVKAYGGYDEVLAYSPPDENGRWSVKAHRVKKVGDEWVREGKPQDARQHSTEPEARELAAGPVARLPAMPAAQVRYTEPRADGKPFPNAPDRGGPPVAKAQENAPAPESVSAAPVAEVPTAAELAPAAEPQAQAAPEAAPAADAQAPEPSEKPATDKIEDIGEKIGGARKDTAESGGTAMFSRSTSDPEAQALRALSENDELFALPKSDKDTMEGVVFDNDPTIKIKKDDLPGLETMWTLTMPSGRTARITVRKASPYGPSPYSADFDGTSYSWNTERPGDNPEDVDPATEDVWLDVVNLEGKGEGAKVYNIATTFAHNTGRIFIGDPNGVSPDAMRRRPQHMLSSALKFGTTRHLAPHPEQTRGNKAEGIPPLQWVYGDDLGNIRRLVDLNIKLLENDAPAFKNLDFDVNTGDFLDATSGRRVSLDAVGKSVTRARDVGGEGLPTSLAGRTTVARVAVLRALLREEGRGVEGENGEGNWLLAGLVRLGAVHPGATRGILYSLKQPGAAQAPVSAAVKESARRVQNLVDIVSAQWENAPTIVVVQNLQDPKVPQAVRDEDAKQREGGATGEPEGFFHGGKVYLVASAIDGDRGALRVLFHETLGHFGLRGTFGRELGVILDRIALLNQGKVRAKAKEYGLDYDKQSDRRMAAEEVLAEMAQTNPELGWVQRAIAAIRSLLRNIVPGFAAMKFSDPEIIANFIMPARAWVEGGDALSLLRAAAPVFDRTEFSRTDTDAFRRWFGDSKVVDAQGKPLVVYHGTTADFARFDLQRGGAVTGAADAREGFFFASNPKAADQFTWKAGDKVGSIMPVYLSMQNPAYSDLVLTGGNGRAAAMQIRDAKAAGHDGVVFRDSDMLDHRGQVFVAFRPEQIKSAIGNRGTFDPENADVRFSRASDAMDTLRSAATAKGLSTLAGDLLQSDRSFNWWHRTIGTQFQKAKDNPEFGKVYEAGQDYLHDTSAFANDAAALAPDVVPQLKGWKDAFKSLRLADDDAKKLSAAVFQGTLDDKRVYSDAELQSGFGMNDRQIGLYRQFRNSVDRSLDILVATDVARFIGQDIPPAFKQMISSGDTGRFRGLVTAYAKTKLAEAQDALKATRKANRDKMAAMWADQKRRLEGTIPGSRLAIEQQLEDEQSKIRAEVNRAEEAAKAGVQKWTTFERTTREKYERIDQLQEEGYAPLMRFGQYTVYVTGPAGEQEFFGLYETQADANRAAREFRESAAFTESKVVTGVLSEEAYKQFSGMAPETLELFAEVADVEKTPLFEEYLRRAKSNRSALKRLISRKGIAGYSEDSQRVLASFLTSNARASAGNLHLGDMARLVEDIPKEKGDVKDEAIKLQQYVQNPTEEAQRLRGLLFVNYLGGSVASALVNMTQPFMMTFPYLSQYGGAAKAAARLGAAMKASMSKPTGELGRALAQAEKEGIVSPQELHQLQAESSRTMGSHPGVRRLLFAWGSLFSLAEQFNRRVSFIAAWNTAKEQGIADAFKFASEAVDQTQGVYNRGNRPNWARGALGATLFTFKQYSISYMEFLKRLPPKERAIALMVLMLAAGAQGLPFGDDLDDLIDSIGQALGYDTNAKAWKNQVLTDAIGAEGADFALHGFSALPGFPLDVSGRLALSNLIPGSGILLKNKADKSGEVFDILGPIGGFARDALQGEVRPLAIRNLAKGIEMFQTGEYRDRRDRRVVDVDGLEAAVKSIGFQPADVARESRKMQLSNQQVQLARVVEGEIAAEWAQGLADKEPAKVAKARQRLAEWNRDNPRSRIAVNSGQILRRVRELRMSREERFQKTIPREMRGTT